MRRLILMRHAKARPATGEGDHDRPLSPRGQAEALEAARRLAALASPQAALISDSRRTRETFAGAAPALAPDLPCQATRALYGADPAAILAEVRRTPDEIGCLLVIGHNPGIGDLARRLAGEGEARDQARLAEGFPTSCFAILDLSASTWSEVGTPGRLVFLLPADERAGR